MIPEIATQAFSSGPFFAFAEMGKPAIIGWGRGESVHGVQWQKFYAPEDKSSELWSGFSLAGSIQPETVTLFEPQALPSSLVSLPFPRQEPTQAGWNNFCAKISAALASGELKKAVPARGRRYDISPADRRALIETIFANLFSSSDPRTFRFLIREKEDFFFGATPELLFRREKGEIFVPAIAGTRALADISEAQATQELLTSAKEREEHALVVEGILASLRELGFEPSAPSEPEVLRVPGLLHLFTPIKAADIPSLSGEKILRALHPTPAVGGLPKAAGQNFLLHNEPWDRGLFAAPIFFRLAGRELCLVGIRSALLRQDSLHFFAGAGFVAGSSAQAEWKETERKMDVMQSFLTGKIL